MVVFSTACEEWSDLQVTFCTAFSCEDLSACSWWQLYITVILHILSLEIVIASCHLSRYENQRPYETPQDTSKTVLQSPTKVRILSGDLKSFLKVACESMLQCLQVLYLINLLLLKQRQNPFNSDVIANHGVEEKNGRMLDGALDQTQSPNEGEFLYVNSSYLCYFSYLLSVSDF